MTFFNSTYPAGRKVCHIVGFVLFTYWAMPQCIAAKIRQHDTSGVYLTHDSHLLQSLEKRTPGTYWIDGYQMSISNQTLICWHDATLQFHDRLSRAGQSFTRLRISSSCETAPQDIDIKSAWLQYRAIQRVPTQLKAEFRLTTARIDVWKSGARENAPEHQNAPAQPSRQTLCASPKLHELRYPNEGPIDVVCDAEVNRYIESILAKLLKHAPTKLDLPTAPQEPTRFYIVRPFQVNHNYDFEAIDGNLISKREVDGYPAYENPHAHATVRETVYAPDGATLIVDSGLTNLKNEAQCAALLSYSLASEQQQLIQHLFLVQRAKFSPWSFDNKTNSTNNVKGTFAFVSQTTARVLRLGIRQMYLAGYDIQYAPFAWSVEQGKQIRGPVDEPRKRMPWYATYAFNAISHLYSNVDYSKLKRGRKEYQQFLVELRKADPQAFAPQPHK